MVQSGPFKRITRSSMCWTASFLVAPFVPYCSFLFVVDMAQSASMDEIRRMMQHLTVGERLFLRNTLLSSIYADANVDVDSDAQATTSSI